MTIQPTNTNHLEMFMSRTRLSIVCISAILAISLGSGARAQDMVYTPLNPSFGGDPFNSAHFLSLAEIQNQFAEEFDFDNEQTTAEQFVESINSSLIAGSASTLSEAVFEEGSPPSGVITLDDATVTYETVGDRIIVRVNDGVTTTVLEVPAP